MRQLAGVMINDSVLIEGLEVPAVIGIYDWEQQITQPLFIDVEMAWDNRRPAASGAIEDALDYEAVSNAIHDVVSRRSWGLIEEVAEALATLILADFNTSAIRLKVAKPTAIQSARSVAVMIERKASE